MTYRVFYTDQFHNTIEAQLVYWTEQGAALTRTAAWLTDLFDLVDSLDELPYRFPIAEPETRGRGIQIHKIAFRDYLIFYHVDDEQHTVYLLGIQHGRRQRGAEEDDQ